MAEYIDREKARDAVYARIDELRADKEFNIAKEICIIGVKKHIKAIPNADVVEREKIDKAIEEIKGQFYVLLKDEISIEESIEEIWWNNALAKTLEIIKRNIGE